MLVLSILSSSYSTNLNPSCRRNRCWCHYRCRECAKGLLPSDEVSLREVWCLVYLGRGYVRDGQ